jgi:hypothetical protein
MATFLHTCRYRVLQTYSAIIRLFKPASKKHKVASSAAKLIRTEETERLSSFPQDFCSGATEKKG